MIANHNIPKEKWGINDVSDVLLNHQKNSEGLEGLKRLNKVLNKNINI